MEPTTTTPQAPGTPASPQSPANNPAMPRDFIAEASKALRTPTLESQREAAPEVAPTTETPETAEAPTTTETVVTALTQDAEGKWHRPDGSYASQEEIAAQSGTTAPESAPETEETERKILKLTGDPQRGGKEYELDVTDIPAEIVDLLQQMENERGKKFEYGKLQSEFSASLERAEEQEARARVLQAVFMEAPDTAAFDILSAEQRVELAKALVTEHLDDLLPHLQTLADENHRRVARVEAEREREKRRFDFEGALAREVDARRVFGAVRKLIPAETPADMATAFLRDADADLAQAVRQGKKVTQDNLSEILGLRIRLYGFARSNGNGQTTGQSGDPAVAPAVPSVPRLAVARPKSGSDAEAIAQRAKETQSRLKQSQTTRSLAAAIAPQGVGALPIESEKPPKGATIEEASKWKRKQAAVSTR